MIVQANGRKLSFKLPGCFDHCSADELANMPVQVVQLINGALVSSRYADILEAANVIALEDFIGPMNGRDYDTGAQCMRFESAQAYEILSE